MLWSDCCFPADMIPENALEEMTKNMDPNLVIVEAKDGVQMKWVRPHNTDVSILLPLNK